MTLASPTKRRLWIATGLVALFAGAGFLILPPIVKSQLESRLSAELGRRVTVGNVRVNPFALSLTLQDFAIRERDGETVFLGWRDLYVRFDALPSLFGEWVLGKVDLDGFQVRVQVNPDQSLNFSDLLAKVTAQAPASGPPGKPTRPIRIASLVVSDGHIDFSDLSPKRRFATTIAPLNFSITDLSTAGGRGAPYRFEASTEAGEKLSWSGTLQAAPFASTGEFSLENILLPKYAPYYADRIRADLTSGILSMEGHYEIAMADDRRTLKLSGGSVRLRTIKLVERVGGAPAVDLPALDVEGIEADALTQKASIGSLTLDGGALRVRREKDGSINLLAMLPPPAAPAQAAGAPPPAPARYPDVSVGELVLKDLGVEVTDLAAPRPAHLVLNGIQLSLRNVSLAPKARMPLAVSFGWTPQGTVRVDGVLGINPIFADVRADVAGLDMRPLSPYLEQFANARVASGAFTANLAAAVSSSGGDTPAATVSGDLQVDKFGLVDGSGSGELAGFGSFKFRGLRAATAPILTVALSEIDVEGPYARVVVAADKSLNLSAVLKSTSRPAPSSGGGKTPASAAPAAAPPAIDIGKVVISGGDFSYTDRSIEPNVSMDVGRFGGSITGLSSANPAKAAIDLSALVDGSGRVSVGGRLDPLGAVRSVDMRVGVRDVDLLPLSPYSGKYAGYELARGKLAVDVKLLVNGSRIDASNVITVNQFTFGSPVSSPEATGLPVRLGVALLKDIDGNIVIDVPVQGSTDDPNFRIGRVVLRVIVNLLTKAAVSPFALLGSAFGGGGEELAYQDFAPGSSEIQAAEVVKLQTMAKALSNRPGLSLGLEGSYDAAADGYALKRLKLEDEIRQAVWEERRRKDAGTPPQAVLVVSPLEEEAVVKGMFDTRFPPGTSFGTPLPPPPAVVAPPPPPEGFARRLIGYLTLKSFRERRAAKRRNALLESGHRQAIAAAVAAGLPLDEMRGRLAEAMGIDDNELRALAGARAKRVRDYLAGTGGIAPGRLFLLNPSAGASKSGRGPRVFLQLQ